ncbi:MAG: MaoC family dehydratase [Pseudomonadota bacterium]|nr:MaoC family dehydratase [Pseudomonadota bacterium]
MKTNRSLFFEDFEVGQVIETGSHTLQEKEIIEFGLKYAPLPYHTDAEAAKETSFGGLIAAGYQTAAMTFGLFARTGALAESGMGSPGVDSLRWKRPVRAGDTLHALANILELSPAEKEGGHDAVRIRYDTLNQHDEIVLTLTSLHFVRRRHNN